MPAKAPSSSKALVELIRDSRLLPDATAGATLANVDLPADPVHAATALVKKGVLTQFQANQLLAGRKRGFRLGEYLIQDLLGKGGMGSVYLALHQTLGRKVAIKVLPANASKDKIALERFLREARTAAALDHPNIVKLYDVCRLNDLHYIVMEYVAGQTLEQLCKNGGMAPGRAAGYIAQAAAGLQHAHEKGFIHRDVKPANLILANDGTVKILDMGLARAAEATDSVTQQFESDATYGTADYAAPEQAVSSQGLDIRVDIYSLGATFYALVTGRPPFAGSTASKLVAHQLKSAPSLSSLDKTVPPELAAVVEKMMAKKPADRYRTPADVILALQPWLTDSPNLTAGVNQTEAAKSSLSTRRLKGATKKSRKPRRKSGWKWAALATVLILAGGGVAAGVYFKELWQPNPTSEARAPSPGPNLAAKPTPKTANPEPKPNAATPATKSPAVVATPVAHTPPKPVWKEGKVVYTLDLSKQKPFQMEATNTGTASKTGAGDFPSGWSVKTWVADHRAIGFAEEADGGFAIGTRPKAGNAILFAPETDFGASKFVKLRFEYRSAASERLCTVRVREMGSQKTENANLPTVKDWKTFEQVYDVSAFKNAVRVEFHNSHADAELRIRAFQLVAVER